jgi:hypothetical protein
MALQFVGDVGIYFLERDAIKFTALTVGAHIDCYATRSALAAIGCTPHDPPQKLLETFEKNRDLMELAAMVKYRRSTAKVTTLLLVKEDLSEVQPRARERSNLIGRPALPQL